MKKYISYLVLFSILTSCSGFLDEEPISSVTDKNYYQTAEDAVGAVNAIYESVGIGSVAQWQGTGDANTPYGGVFFNDFWVLQDLYCDNATQNNDWYVNIDNMTMSETSGFVGNLWFNFYRSINTANVAIFHIPTIDMDEEEREHLLGEALFWRGLLYAEMVKLWGDVPYMTDPTTSVDAVFDVTRANQLDVLIGAITDLEQAKDLMTTPYRSGYGRADDMVAKAVLAKVYLIKASKTQASSDYQKVVDYAHEVIASQEYALYDDFSDNFIISKEHGKESILSINYETEGLWGSQFLVQTLPNAIAENSPSGAEGPENAQNWIMPTADLYNSYADGDTRRSKSIMSEYTYSDSSTVVFADVAYPYYYTKYWDKEAEPQGKNSGQNYPYMRFSEVYLLRAEALNEIHSGPTAEAYEAINTVRNRAFGDNESGAHDLSGLDYTTFRKALLDERRWELSLEGSRWFDLVRLSEDFVNTIKNVKPNAQTTNNHKLFPIPQYERNLNSSITQNPGY